jgi:serine phosphatase RsbU (regulator of sigma subunit)/tetratricopeptide (TPR) repeat protein
LCFGNAISQSKAQDSLKSIFYTNKNPEKRYEASLYLVKELFRDNLDSSMAYLKYADKNYTRFHSKKLRAFYYYLKAYAADNNYSFDSTIAYCDSCIALCSSKELSLQRADCIFSKAVAHYYKGEADKAAYCFKSAIPVFIENKKQKKALNGYSNLIGIYQGQNNKVLVQTYFAKALTVADTTKDFSVLANLYSNMASFYDKSHSYQKVLELLFTALKYAEKSGKLNGGIHTQIGMAYMNTNNYQKAEEYLKQGYELAQKSENQKHILESAAEYAMYFQNLGKFDTALSLLNSVEKYADEENLYMATSEVYRGLTWSYTELGDYSKAHYYADKMLKLRRDSEDDNAISEALEYKAHIYFKQKNYSEAIHLYKEGLVLAERIGNKIFIKNTYQALARAYDELKDYKNANEYLKKYTVLNDSVTNKLNSEFNAELEEKYASEKKQNEIMLLSKESKLKGVMLEKSKQQRLFLLVGLALVGGLLGFAVYSFLQKKKANTLITQQKQEVEHQKEVIEEKQKEIFDSINYAKRIQYALLASDELLSRNLSSIHDHASDHFVFFEPKDIVSGDFYWATIHQDKFYLAVCDSTGHGIPGAFMSLLNIGFLSEAIKEKEIQEPHEVFNYVRKRLIETISKDEQQDGMDGILLCIDNKMRTVSYAAANNSPVLVRQGECIDLPKDKMPVGKGEKTESFKRHLVNLQPGDRLYVYTDGYADQFGGPKGKKFKYKQLNDLLLSVSGKPVTQQAAIISEEFTKWKGSLEQVDDVCVIGICV